MEAADAADVLWWRRLDREVQGLADGRRRRAQVVVDVAEAARAAAVRRGVDPVDDLLDLHHRVSRPGSRALVEAALAYLRAEPGTAAPAVPRRLVVSVTDPADETA